MTLGGLAAAVGLVIDDAIVVVENIVLHRDSGQSRAESIRNALREIRVPLVGSTITPIVVFVPLITITGVTGTFFRALAVTVGTALLTSSLWPSRGRQRLSHYLLRKHQVRRSARRGPGDRFHGRDHARLRSRLAVHPGVSFRARRGMRSADCRFVLLLSRARQRSAARHGRRRIHPRLLPMPAGSSLDDTNAVLLAVERMLLATPEVENTSRRTGMQLGLAAVTEAESRRLLGQAGKRGPRRPIDEIISELLRQAG